MNMRGRLDCLLVLMSLSEFLLVCLAYSSAGNTVNHLWNSTIMTQRHPPSIHGDGHRLTLMNARFNRRPRKRNLDNDQLLEILGGSFDSNWMSMEKPSDINRDDATISYVVREDVWPYMQLRKALQTANLTKELSDISGTSSMDSNMMSLFKKWLLKKASCPVRYAWEDIGSMFWPRWIRRGQCASVPATCSWPPGMHCVETRTSNLHILRWQCRTPKNKSKRKKAHSRNDWNKRVDYELQNLRCHWIIVPYPITSACHCTC